MQNVFIINFNSLYEILDEIKENLSFKIIKFENEKDFRKKLDLDKLDYLVISKTDHKLLLNNNITDKNFLDFKDLPLPFKIIKFDNEKDFKKNLDLDRIDYLVISKTDHKLLLNNNITDKNFLSFNDLPLSFKKLLELINIKLIKLKFNQQSKITIKGYELDLNSKFFSKGNLKLKLTEKEIEII